MCFNLIGVVCEGICRRIELEPYSRKRTVLQPWVLLLEEESGDFDICRHRWTLNISKHSKWSDHATKLGDKEPMHTCLTWCGSVSEGDDLHRRCL